MARHSASNQGHSGRSRHFTHWCELTGDTIRNVVSNDMSVKLLLLYGVPQGSVLGLFLLHVAELFDVVAGCGFTGHTRTPTTHRSTSARQLLNAQRRGIV